MYDEDFLIGLLDMIRDYLVNEITIEDINDYISNYELKG